ncbi:AHH domain-containing protein [Lampropedia aestuarii]|uniref:AHH domain-containing protein n=1 Tax=Lampropedia aestuarii TaxID=2562762 RepID=UPI001982675A|nr:AHH domain-containing protein [Lampropedia aestuarii]
MNNPHGHHIIFKGDFDSRPQIKLALERSRAIVDAYGIDPVNDIGALMWAPNKGHSKKNAGKVAQKLEEADGRLKRKGINPKSECGKLAMFAELQKIGREVFFD